MYSPKKLCGPEKNFYEIANNSELAKDLELFFNDPNNYDLWKIVTSRQKITRALRNTESIPLRLPMPDIGHTPQSTKDWNQVTRIVDTELIQIPVFKKTKEWLEEIFKAQGVKEVEFGRIFFSKHLANSEIDEHTDEGRYFDYYDRFHFVIDQVNQKNIFHIRDEDVFLMTGNLYWVNNHVPHWLKNHSDRDRINLIIDARLT